MPKSTLLALRLTLALILTFSLTCDLDHATPGLFADEAVYAGMTQSLARDFDLSYSPDDLERLFMHFPAGPTGIILKQNADSSRIVYAKPFIYPLVAAPLYLLVHLNGLILLNALCWWICLYCVSKAWHHRPQGFLFGFVSLFVSAFAPYTLWMHPEMFTAMLVAAGTLFWRRAAEARDAAGSTTNAGFMAALFTLAATIKPQLLIFPALGILQFSLRRRPRSIIRLIALGIIIILTVIAASFLLTGEPNAYGGNRKIFVNQFPFEDPTAHFDRFGNTWSTENAKMYLQPAVIAWNCFFFVFGRFTGIVPYFFPSAVALSLLVIRRFRSSIGPFVLAGVLIICLVQITLIPTNYHGGGGALGNRYFLLLVPALLIALSNPPSLRMTLLTAVIAACFSGPFLIRPFSSSFHPGDHAMTGIYTRFPAEWTLVDSLPIFDVSRNRVIFDGVEAGFLFLDRGIYGKETDGFWVLGDSRAEFFMKSPRPLSSATFRIGEPLADVRVRIGQGRFRDDFPCAAGVLLDRDIPLSGHPFIDLYGRRFWIYDFSITVHGGGIPRYRTDSTDSRYLGVFVRPRVLHSAE